MLPHNPTEVINALELLRRGRFTETATILTKLSERVPASRKRDSLAQVLLADSLQRIGQNSDAETIASRNLRTTSAYSARCHFVLANALRARGDLPKAIEHLQIAVASASTDHDTACWAQLR